MTGTSSTVTGAAQQASVTVTRAGWAAHAGAAAAAATTGAQAATLAVQVALMLTPCVWTAQQARVIGCSRSRFRQRGMQTALETRHSLRWAHRAMTVKQRLVGRWRPPWMPGQRQAGRRYRTATGQASGTAVRPLVQERRYGSTLGHSIARSPKEGASMMGTTTPSSMCTTPHQGRPTCRGTATALEVWGRARPGVPLWQCARSAPRTGTSEGLGVTGTAGRALPAGLQVMGTAASQTEIWGFQLCGRGALGRGRLWRAQPPWAGRVLPCPRCVPPAQEEGRCQRWGAGQELVWLPGSTPSQDWDV